MSVRPIQKVLVANRGEIARRVMRTCRSMGIGTVAVFSDADASALHVGDADEAIHIGPAPSRESYLAIDRIVDAARRTGADAVHPGYGFLSENAAFAAACRDAGLVFIGPTEDAIRAMGSKREAKRLAVSAGVPVIPGYDGEDQSTDVLAANALDVGLPVLLKASAGGGGKGMRIVRVAGELVAAIESARREAESSFGDGTLLIERYVERPRHVEIQILGDHHGNLVHVFERECSIQRRHQKIVEECPSPALTTAMRDQMGAAAVSVGRAIGYTNAGTVELVLAPDGSFYFLEVNTRLQVEHPVTEMVAGLDLVREQIRIAQGEELGYGQDDLAMKGAAIECRLYAEDPKDGFLPQSGRIVDFHFPDVEGLRIDSGVATGSDVSIHYDPMLAKVVAHGRNRNEAVQRMIRALSLASVQGIVTNRELLLHVLRHDAFVAGELHTHFIEEHLADVLALGPDVGRLRAAAVFAVLAGHEARRAVAPSPRVPSGFRFGERPWQRVDFDAASGALAIEYRAEGAQAFALRVDGVESSAKLVSMNAPSLVVEGGDGVRRAARVVFSEGVFHVHTPEGDCTLVERPRFAVPGASVPAGGCVAPMPGKIVALEVAVGDAVDTGQVLLVMEAMKMEHSVKAAAPGRITAIHVAAGDQVDADQVLVVVEPADAA